MHDKQKKSPDVVTTRTGQAPAPVKLHTGISAWRVGDLREWLTKRSMS